MKYFAKLGLNNKVVGLTHIHDSEGPTEEIGVAYLNKLHGYPFWKEFKKDGSIRKNGARIGGTYDEDRDAFIPISPLPSFVLNETTCRWEPPVPYPGDGIPYADKKYYWNEPTQSWNEH